MNQEFLFIFEDFADYLPDFKNLLLHVENPFRFCDA